MKKVKFSFIDIIIILAVIAFAVVGLKAVIPGLGNGGNTQEVVYTFLADGVDSGVSQLFEVGEIVRTSYAEEVYATVVEVSEVPYKESKYFANEGRYVSYEVEGKSSLYVKLSCDAVVTDTSITHGNLPIRVGEISAVDKKGYAANGYIVAIEEGLGE